MKNAKFVPELLETLIKIQDFMKTLGDCTSAAETQDFVINNIESMDGLVEKIINKVGNGAE